MREHPNLSAYLVPRRPRLSWRNRLRLILWQLPRPSTKTGFQLGSWAALLFVIVGSLSTSTLLSPASSFYAPNSFPQATPVQLSDAVAAPTLPGGPSGQLLPPGTLAAPYTFNNGYSAGQCTWYVAGRRQVPRNWGNANTWYDRARAAGMAEGRVPAIAAIAWSPSGYFGHVAIVEAIEGNNVLISEMNYLGPYKIDRRWITASSFQYIY